MMYHYQQQKNRYNSCGMQNYFEVCFCEVFHVTLLVQKQVQICQLLSFNISVLHHIKFSNETMNISKENKFEM